MTVRLASLDVKNYIKYCIVCAAHAQRAVTTLQYQKCGTMTVRLASFDVKPIQKKLYCLCSIYVRSCNHTTVPEERHYDRAVGVVCSKTDTKNCTVCAAYMYAAVTTLQYQKCGTMTVRLASFYVKPTQKTLLSVQHICT